MWTLALALRSMIPPSMRPASHGITSITSERSIVSPISNINCLLETPATWRRLRGFVTGRIASVVTRPTRKGACDDRLP